jgi:hypothetical protein
MAKAPLFSWQSFADTKLSRRAAAATNGADFAAFAVSAAAHQAVEKMPSLT